MPFLFRTIHREKNYIVNQMQKKSRRKMGGGGGEKEKKKSARTLCHLLMYLEQK